MILQQGSRGVWVMALQLRLRDGGLPGLGPVDSTLRVDGDFGPHTKAAVVKLQSAYSQFGAPDGTLEDPDISRLQLAPLVSAIQAAGGRVPPSTPSGSPNMQPGVTAEPTTHTPTYYSPTTVPGFEGKGGSIVKATASKAVNLLRSPWVLLSGLGLGLIWAATRRRGK